MTWRIPVIWQMTGTLEIEAERLEDAMAHACDSFNATDGEFKDGSLELDCYDTETVRAIFNKNLPDGFDTAFPELKEYEDTGDGLRRYIKELDLDGLPARDNLGEYEVIFDLFGERYYCFIEEENINQALGVFFRENPHITYEMVVDHVEI